MRLHVLGLLSILAFTPVALHPQAPSVTYAIDQDPPPNKKNPAAMVSFQLPSHGSQLNALMYLTAGAGPHPTILLLHGFPGNERNLDLAQTIRRAGYNVLYFNYRGSWGTPGTFSFIHCIEDTQAALAYLRDPANASRFRVDPANLILIGHSMGGFMARYVAAHDSGIKAVALISAADMANDRIEGIPVAYRSQAVAPIANSFAKEGLAPLACTAKDLAEEAVANADNWNIPALAPALASRPVLVITSDDGLAPSNDLFFTALKKSGSIRAVTLHLPTDHAYSDERIALQTSILNWLSAL